MDLNEFMNQRRRERSQRFGGFDGFGDGLGEQKFSGGFHLNDEQINAFRDAFNFFRTGNKNQQDDGKLKMTDSEKKNNKKIAENNHKYCISKKIGQYIEFVDCNPKTPFAVQIVIVEICGWDSFMSQLVSEYSEWPMDDRFLREIESEIKQWLIDKKRLGHIIDYSDIACYFSNEKGTVIVGGYAHIFR